MSRIHLHTRFSHLVVTSGPVVKVGRDHLVPETVNHRFESYIRKIIGCAKAVIDFHNRVKICQLRPLGLSFHFILASSDISKPNSRNHSIDVETTLCNIYGIGCCSCRLVFGTS